MYNTNRQMGLTRPAVPQSRPTPAPPSNSPRPAAAPPRPPAPPMRATANAQNRAVGPNATPAVNTNVRPVPGSAGPLLPPAQRVVAQPARTVQPALGAGGFLPPAQPSAQRPNNNAGGRNASTAQYANAPVQYANAPVQYANIPPVQNGNAPANPYGSMNSVAAASANARRVDSPYAEMRPVQNRPANTAPRPAQPPAAQNLQRAEPNANQVMTEKRNDGNPSGDKTRTIAALADRAMFRGQIVASTGNGGLLMKTSRSDASETLIHLPKEAANQLRERSGTLLKRSMENGREGPEVQVAHLKGQWSATETKAPTKKIG